MPSDKRAYTPGLSAAVIRAENLFQAAFGPPVHVAAKDWRVRENPALACACADTSAAFGSITRRMRTAI